jgi:uncharacterized protein (DUF342 family)
MTKTDDEYRELEEFLLNTGLVNDELRASILERRTKQRNTGLENQEEADITLNPFLDQINQNNRSEADIPKKKPADISIETKITKPEYAVAISVSNDFMTARISIEPEKAQNLNEENLHKILGLKNIKFGIITDVVKEILQTIKQNIPVKDKIIACGQPAVHGKSAIIYYFFRLENSYTTKSENHDSTGIERLEYKDNKNISMVQKGDLLARKIPMVPEVNGKNIRGETLVARPTRDIGLIAGKYTELDENGNLWALRDGMPVFEKDGRVSVNPLYRISGDLDLSVGNINFNGIVEIDGSIPAGFSVQAENLIVHNSVEAAKINVSENAEIFGCYSGGEKGCIKTGKNCFISHCNRGRLEIKGDLLIGRELVGIQAFVSGNLSFRHKRGTIIGGNIFVGGNLSCGNLGSALGVTTCIYMGRHPIIKQRIEVCVKKISETEQKIKIMKNGLRTIHTDEKKVSIEDKLLLIAKIKETIASLEKQNDETKKAQKTLEAELYRYTPHFVRVEGRVYPGVRIQIGEAVLKNTTLLNCVEIYEDPTSRKIKWRTLNP